MENDSKKNPVDELLCHLSNLAVEWRGKQPQPSPEKVAEYHKTLRTIIDLGHTELLNTDEELPDAFMPDWYFKWVNDLAKKQDNF
jgi:hypothetical protein